MQAPPLLPPKPVTDIWRPDLTRLPSLTPARRLFRYIAHQLAKLVLLFLSRSGISGMEHLPARGPALFVVNHLGDADGAMLLAALPRRAEVLAKIEMRDFPLVGTLMDWYGCIWLHRGMPDRRALRCALQAFEQGRCVIVAPEGRYSLASGLEPAGRGAAYLAMRGGVPVVPIALTGTQNANVYGSLRALRRPRLTMTVGQPLRLDAAEVDRAALEQGTLHIMLALAKLLPEEYRGAYRELAT